MSIQVNFYKNFKKRENSTLQPGVEANSDQYTCNIKSGCSITDPVFEVLSVNGNPAALGYNYAYIPSFNRYYHVNNWTWNMGVWTATMNVDVLASFKTDIGNLTKYINRSAYEFDTNLMDSLYPTQSKANVSFINNDNPFRVAPFGSFIVGIIGTAQANVPNVGGINYYLMSYTEMAELIDYLMSSSFANLLKDDANGFSDQIVKSMVSPTDYIVSCIWFPFAIDPGVSGTVQPKIGWWNNITPLSNGCKPLGGGFMDSLKYTPPGKGTDWHNEFTLTDHTQISRGAWLNCEPYSNYVFHLDPWGDIVLDGKIISNYSKISYDITCEVLTGLGTLEIYGSSQIITRRVAQVGVPVSIAQIINNVDNINAGTAVKGGLAGVFQNLKNGRIQQAIKNVLSFQTPYRGHGRGIKQFADIGKDIVSGIEAYTSEADSTGANGSIISYTGTYMNGTYTQGAYVKITRFNLVADNNTETGKPLASIRQISNIPGYIECAEGDHNIAALANEKDMISSYLVGGFFYE